jgi:hypothetical protein
MKRFDFLMNCPHFSSYSDVEGYHRMYLFEGEDFRAWIDIPFDATQDVYWEMTTFDKPTHIRMGQDIDEPKWFISLIAQCIVIVERRDRLAKLFL